MTRTFSYWEWEEWLRPPDLLVIGAGIVGATTALRYKEQHPGHEVLIVDKGLAPEGASTRNAGFTCIGSISEHLADMDIAGEETVLNRISRRWNGLNLLKQTMGEPAMDYHHTGGYEIFTNPALFEHCRENVDQMNRHMNERLGLEEVYSVTEYEGYPAIYNHVEGAINSGRMMRSLHQKLALSGVRIWWNTPVRSVEPGRVILSDDLELSTRKIAVTTNGFVSRLLDLPVKPARGLVFITHPIEDLKWKGTFNHNAGYVYFRNVENRLLLGGARDLAKEQETTDQFGVNPKIREYLLRFADEVLRLPSGWEVDMEWSGIMGVTENKEPVIRQVKPNVYAAAGLSGMGIAIGMQVARELTDLIVSD